MQADLTAYLEGIVSQQYSRNNIDSQLFLCFQPARIFLKLVSTVNAAPQSSSVASGVAVNPRAASAVMAHVIEDS